MVGFLDRDWPRRGFGGQLVWKPSNQPCPECEMLISGDTADEFFENRRTHIKTHHPGAYEEYFDEPPPE